MIAIYQAWLPRQARTYYSASDWFEADYTQTVYGGYATYYVKQRTLYMKNLKSHVHIQYTKVGRFDPHG